jgi:hypothetical protein
LPKAAGDTVTGANDDEAFSIVTGAELVKLLVASGEMELTGSTDEEELPCVVATVGTAVVLVSVIELLNKTTGATVAGACVSEALLMVVGTVVVLL